MAMVLRHVDYSQFGPRGNEFQQLYEATWAGITQTWDQRRQTDTQIMSLPRLEDALRTCDRSGYWFSSFMAGISVMRMMNTQQFVPFWEQFRKAFAPPLTGGQLLAKNQRAVYTRQALLETITQVKLSEPINSTRRQLNNVCYGPYTEGEIRYISRYHPQLLEIGAGSGYLASVLQDHGIDMVAVDNNTYSLSDGSLFEWTRELVEQRILLAGDARLVPQYTEGRSLLISWPEGGSSFPFEAIEPYAQAGGRSLLIKFGGFIGVHSSNQPGYRPPHNAASNITRFFQALARGWKEVSGSKPEFIPEAFENNLWVFRRL